MKEEHGERGMTRDDSSFRILLRLFKNTQHKILLSFIVAMYIIVKGMFNGIFSWHRLKQVKIIHKKKMGKTRLN